MRRLLLLIFVGNLIVQSGCIREHTSGDTLILRMKWWTLLWGFVVPIAVGAIMFAKHPSIWVNGKWQPWWKLRGWDAREIGYAVGVLVVMPLMSIAFLFDRFEVAPDHIREISLSPFRGTRRIAFSDIARVELRSPATNDGMWRGLKPRKEKTPPTMRVVLKGGRQEDFEGQLIRHGLRTILERLRKVGVPVANAPPNNSPAKQESAPRHGFPTPRHNPNAPPRPSDFDPFENAHPKFERIEPK